MRINEWKEIRRPLPLTQICRLNPAMEEREKREREREKEREKEREREREREKGEREREAQFVSRHSTDFQRIFLPRARGR